tara:strand:+ start:481 stop:690 length:210 start_codon:yes stop_codon:yes gene_type:complete
MSKLTKEQIVEELLAAEQISVEEAVTLLSNKTQQGVTYITNHPPNSYWTTSPDWSTDHPVTPIYTTTRT